MKKGMKKLLGVLMLAVCMLGLTACGTKAELPNEAFYQSKSDTYMQMLASMDEEELDAVIEDLENNYADFEQQVALYPYIGGTGQKFDFTAEAYVSLFKSYASNLEDLGAFVGVKEYEGGKTSEDGETTYNTVYEFEKHDMRLSLVFDKEGIVITVTADPIYSIGEIAQKAAMNTLIGMGVVFSVLILISLIISCFSFIPKLEEKFRKKAEPAEAPAEKPAVPAAVAAEPVQEETDDLELIAVITAAVAATLGTSTDGFTVRSIRRKSNNKWKKA